MEVGAYTYGHNHIRIAEMAPQANVKIGKFCSFANEGIVIHTGDNHRTDWITTYPFGGIHQNVFNSRSDEGNVSTKGDVIIGNDVWVGKHAKIMSGVTIGHGAVIGAYAVVAKNVPPYSIFVGNPGEVKRKRFSDEDIQFLLNLAWWDWDDQKINEYAPLLCSTDISKLREIFSETC